jgi:hypothetical protein
LWIFGWKNKGQDAEFEDGLMPDDTFAQWTLLYC